MTGKLTIQEKEACAEEKNEIYKELLKNITTEDLSREVRETLEQLREKGLKLAIGSSSKTAGFILERIGLGDFFDTVSDGNNITFSKPDPEVFLKAAQSQSTTRTMPGCRGCRGRTSAAKRGNMDCAGIGVRR